MRKIMPGYLGALLLILLTGCQVVWRPLSALSPTLPSTPTSPAPTTPAPTLTPFAILLPTPSQSSPPVVVTQPSAKYQVHFHPDGPLYVGDKVSLEVIPPQDIDLKGSAVQLRVPTSQGDLEVGPVNFSPFGIGGREQATLWWSWDTAGLMPGEYDLALKVTPGGLAWTEKVKLLDAGGLPAATWKVAEIDCCVIHYLTGTRADRDIQDLIKMIEIQVDAASQHLNREPSVKIPIVMVPRVLGHGGFSSQEIAVSFLDRNYAGDATPEVLHHELIHWLDGRLGGDMRPAMLVEGLAVYLTGGHFKLEPLTQRAAALLPPRQDCTRPGLDGNDSTPTLLPLGCGLGRYVPLQELADDFYHAQHEIGYLEAGALVKYMVETWGWEAFSGFYRDIHARQVDGQAVETSPGQAIGDALQIHFGLSLAGLNERFVEELKAESPTPQVIDDLRLSIQFYDSVRRYQLALDPSAYFMVAWLPDLQEMRKRGITGDLLRHPQAVENLALEMMFVSADRSLRSGDFGQVEVLLLAVQQVMDGFDGKKDSPFSSSALATDYYGVALAAQSAGYQPQRVEFEGEQARLFADTADSKAVELFLRRYAGGWQIMAEAGLSFSQLVFPGGLKLLGSYKAN